MLSKKRVKPAAKPHLLPARYADHTLCPQLTALLTTAPAPTFLLSRVCWPLPGRLGFGSQPIDRADPEQWLRDNYVRVVIDVSEDLVDKREYARIVESAGAVLLHLPTTTKTKMGKAESELYLSTCRTLHQMLKALRQADADEPPFSMYVADSRGGGTAAMLVELLIAMELNCSLPDVCTFVTRYWNRNLPAHMTPLHLFPEGDVLKQSLVTLFARLRDQPITATLGTNARVDPTEILSLHKVLNTGRAALRLLDVNATVMVNRPSFDRAHPLLVATWLLRNVPVPKRPLDEGSCQPASKRYDDGGDGDDDEDDFNTSHRRRWRRRRQPENDMF